MAIQSQVGVAIAYAPESTFGVAAAAGTGKLISRMSSGLTLTKESFTSRQVRPDYQISDLRHGMRSGRGPIEGEVSIGTYDDWFEALLGGTWTAGVTVGPADFATGVTIANGTGDTSTLTFAGAGNLLNKGFKIGDVVRGTGLTTAGNNARNLRIVGLTATVMTVAPQITATGQQASGWSIAVAGRKLLMGLNKRSFTIEQSYADVDMIELFTGARLNSCRLSVPPNGMVTASFDWLTVDGQILDGAQAPYFTTPTDAPNSSSFSGIDGALRMAGADRGIVTSLDLTISNGMSMTGVIGSRISPDIFQGSKTLTGNVSVFLEDASLARVFLNETEVDLVATLYTSTGTPPSFFTLNIQRLKLTSIQKQIADQGGVIVQYGYQALLQSGGNGTAYDQTTIALQRSNV